MKNLKKAAKKIKESENVILYTDSDLDGITSGLIAKGTLEEVGKSPSIFFTNKEDRGYGLNPDSVEMISNTSKKGLLVTMDCGISDFEGVERAKELGFEVIIIDHHKPHEKVPDADLIVCPKLHGDEFKERPNAGIILELSKLILGTQKEEYIEYAALAIFGDMMPHEGPNKEVLKSFEENFPATTGVDVLRRIFDTDKPFKLLQEVFPVLNVTRFVSGTPESFLFFSFEDRKKVEDMARRMIDAYKKRKEKVGIISEKILKDLNDEKIIFCGSSDWPSFMLGKIASQVVSRVDKPVFIYRIKDDIAQGSVRMPKGMDAVEAMKSAEEILENYGGHPPAAGFTIKKERLDDFEKRLLNYFKKE